MSLIKRCGDCKFYQNTSSGEECRKSPPIRLPRKFEEQATSGNRVRDETLIWGWPQVTRNDWCGKFKRKKKVAT